MQVIASLDDELVRARLQPRHLDEVAAGTEMNPGRNALGNRLTRGQAVGVHPQVEMACSGANLFGLHFAFRHGGDREHIAGEFGSVSRLDSVSVLRADKEHAPSGMPGM